MAPRALARVTALITFAYLAKPVAVTGVVPLLALIVGARPQRAPRPVLGAGGHARDSARDPVALRRPRCPTRGVALGQRYHATPRGTGAARGVREPQRLRDQVAAVRDVLAMFRETMRTAAFGYSSRPRHRRVPARGSGPHAVPLPAWLIAGLAYTYAVVTVERVDYYMLLLLPPLALLGGAAIAWLAAALAAAGTPAAVRWAPASPLGDIRVGRRAEPRRDRALLSLQQARLPAGRRARPHLDKNALVVVAHYGPDVLYYINRYGWEEDPALWTPFDEESAIEKGARYFISIEDRRLRRNDDLCAWLQRFPMVDARMRWPVYHTDPAMVKPGADAFWRAYRTAALAGNGREFLNRHGLCLTEAEATTSKNPSPPNPTP